MSKLTRRGFMQLTGGVLAAGAIGFPHIARAAGKRVVVVGGGYGGAIAAKYIRMADQGIEVTLIEMDKTYYSCPLSNPVLVGIRDLSVQAWTYDKLAANHGIKVVIDMVTEIDPVGKSVKTKGGKSFGYDALVVSPGVDFKWGAIEGYDEAAAAKMPHAWKAGPQTTILKDQIKALKDGDPVVIVAPPNPFRCPPGPYERAGLIGWYLKQHKPKSKVIILDAKDKFAKQGLFQAGWTANGLPVEWVAGGAGGKVTKVDVAGGKVMTEMDEFKSGAINVIPPQKAADIAHAAGLTDGDWCPVDVKTFESTKHKDIYVIGDAGNIPGMPKSGYSANSEGKVAAAAIVAKLNGKEPGDPSYVNTCYSLVTPDYGISVSLVAVLKDGKIAAVPESGGVSPKEASAAFRKQEAAYAESWYQSVMADTFS